LRLYDTDIDFSGAGISIDGRTHKFMSSHLMPTVFSDRTSAGTPDFTDPIPGKDYKLVALQPGATKHNYVASIVYDEDTTWDDDDSNGVDEMILHFDVVYAVYVQNDESCIELAHIYDYGILSGEKFYIQDANTIVQYPVRCMPPTWQKPVLICPSPRSRIMESREWMIHLM
jgi:hypothetical protein